MAADTDTCVQGYNAYISDRGGNRRLGEVVRLASINWTRLRDATSSATIVVSGSNCDDQSKFLSSIEPHRHELVLYRTDAFGSRRVWEGPIERSGDYPDRFEIQALDVFNYVDARPLTKAWDNSYPNTGIATTRIGNILAYELTHDFTIDTGAGPSTMLAPEHLVPPVNIAGFVQIHHFINEATTSAVTTPYQMTAGEHIDNMAHSGGIDYTVVGRAIHVWDTSRPLGIGPTLTEADFDGPVITSKYGADMATLAITATGTGDYGAAGGGDPYYGVWAKVFTTYDQNATTDPTKAELNSQAVRNLAGRNPVPFEVRVPDNSTIRLRSDLTIDTLVPGTQFPLRATMNHREIVQMQKLDSITVSVDGTGENIQVVLSPANKPDSDGG